MEVDSPLWHNTASRRPRLRFARMGRLTETQTGIEIVEMTASAPGAERRLDDQFDEHLGRHAAGDVCAEWRARMCCCI
jgi:hypothetical protein